MRSFLFLLAAFLAVVVAPVAHANLECISEEELNAGLRKALALYEAKDIDGLRSLMMDAHLFVKARAALYLGRLGARSALAELKALDARYSRFACAACGEFGVAVILIENETEERRKAALLRAATQAAAESGLASSVVNEAAQELARFTGEEIPRRLRDIRTYGARYTVLVHRCRELTADAAIGTCVSQLEAHGSPQEAEAAERVLVSFGAKVAPPVRSLKERALKRIKPEDSTFTIPGTIVARCDRILKQVDPSPAK